MVFNLDLGGLVRNNKRTTNRMFTIDEPLQARLGHASATSRTRVGFMVEPVAWTLSRSMHRRFGTIGFGLRGIEAEVK